MAEALLDTDIFSEVLKRKNQAVLARAAAYLATNRVLTISAISVAEITRGVHRQQQAARFQQFLAALSIHEVLSLDLPSAELGGRIAGDLERVGQPIGSFDPLIAAVAIQHDLTLVTGNLAHFRRFQALGYPLKLDNWRDS